ncbi:S8 family serine peptidase [Variovorax sp. LARHSF232]
MATTGKKRSSSTESIRLESRGQIKLRGVWVDLPPDMAAVMLGAAEPAAAEPPPFPTPAIAAAMAGSPAALCTRLAPVSPFALHELQRLPMDVETSMDPRLQLAVVNRRAGKPSMPVASSDGESVPVVARVTSLAAWADIADVDPGAEIGSTPDGTVIVTGRIPIRKAEAIHQHPQVLSMKASQPVRPLLQDTLKSMGVEPGGAAVAGAGGGAGVVVGIVDIGGDFAHHNFLRPDGGTRLVALWQQGAPARADSPYGYGRLFGRKALDEALKRSDPYRALGYDPGRGSPGSPGSHGTHVMDIAAGNGRGSGQPGVAPQADLIFVEVSARDVDWSGPRSVFNSFGDSVQMLEAVKFIFDTAGDRPCVVNLSLGTNGGPHDGSSLVEQGFDALLSQKPNRAIVLAAGNAQEDGVHTMGVVPAGGQLDVRWTTTAGGGGEFELWYGGGQRLRAELLGPNDEVLASVAPGENFPLGAGNGEIAAFLASRINDPNNKDNVIGIWLAPNWPDGEVTVRLHALVPQEVPFHAWIERMDEGQAQFDTPVASHLLGSLSTGKHTVVVGAYDARKSGEPAASFSSAGPTRDGRPKPEVAAPGMQVMAARSRTQGGVTKKSGTSMAAPAVTGLIALMLAKAHKKGERLSIADIRAKLQDTARADGGAQGWDAQLGEGRASGKAI